MSLRTYKIDFEDESEYPARLFTIVGEVTLRIPDGKPCKIDHLDVAIRAFDEYGIETEVPVTEEWKEKILNHTINTFL
jgi:hypothetical protein